MRSLWDISNHFMNLRSTSTTSPAGDVPEINNVIHRNIQEHSKLLFLG
jgi:hypothetical protein